MNPILRNIIVVILAILAGGLLNGMIIELSPKLIPPPEGADLTTEEGLKAAMKLMEPKHFLMPFLAHAVGTLLAAWLIAKFAASRQTILPYIAGFLFLIGGIMMVMILPSPLWFTLTDLLLAYLPMAWLGIKLAKK
jgi:hypothetical protein